MHLGAFSLLVSDYEPGIAFFCGTLGCELVEDIPQDHKRWVLVQAPDSPLRIVLARADTDAQRAALGNQAGGRVWLFLHTADFATDHARLTRHGSHSKKRQGTNPMAPSPFFATRLATVGI